MGWFPCNCTGVPCGGCTDTPDDMAFVVSGVTVGSNGACCTDYNDTFVLPKTDRGYPTPCYFRHDITCGTDFCCGEEYVYSAFPEPPRNVDFHAAFWELEIYDFDGSTARAVAWFTVGMWNQAPLTGSAGYSVYRWDANGLDRDCTTWSSESFTYTSGLINPFWHFCDFSSSSILVSAV